MSVASTCRALFSFKANRHAMAAALVLGIALQGWSVSAAEYDVTRHGVVGDGATLNTSALQTLIDHCATQGGGTLHFPAGD